MRYPQALWQDEAHAQRARLPLMPSGSPVGEFRRSL